MAGVAGSHLLADEDVSQVSAAGGANYLGASSVGVGQAAHRVRYFGVERGPAAAGVEFVIGAIQRGTAAAATIGAFFAMAIVFSAKGAFGSFMDDNARLFGVELAPVVGRSGVHCSITSVCI